MDNLFASGIPELIVIYITEVVSRYIVYQNGSLTLSLPSNSPGTESKPFLTFSSCFYKTLCHLNKLEKIYELEDRSQDIGRAK